MENQIFDINNYNSQIEWLFNQFPSYQVVGKRAFKPGIETMKAFDVALGEPHRSFRTIHIAGTNGKGSTSHFLAAALSQCGLKVGLYTSPHLCDFRERMKIIENGSFRMISREGVIVFLERWREFFVENKPSFFEITTGMAFDFFAKEKVDIAVIETGLGGRLDSTNIITPILSIITNIGLEHCEHLGFTLEEIAAEKGGIINSGIPVIVGETTPETRPVFKRIAAEQCAPITFAEDIQDPFIQLVVMNVHQDANAVAEAKAVAKAEAETEAEADAEAEAEAHLHISLSQEEMDLKGDYQRKNLRGVAEAIKYLSHNHFDMPKENLTEGLKHAAKITGLHGRWETLSEGGGKPTIICDTGHNAHGMRWVREQLDKISCDYDHIFLIIGMVADKDIDAVAKYLPHDVNYIFTNAQSERSLPAGKLADKLHDYGITGQISKSVEDALKMAEDQSKEGDLIFIGGSNFVVSEVLPLFLK